LFLDESKLNIKGLTIFFKIDLAVNLKLKSIVEIKKNTNTIFK